MKRLLICLLSLIAVESLPAASKPDTAKFYFYKPLPFGTQALYNPVNFILNGGFDIWQISNSDLNRKLLTYPYKKAWASLWNDIKNPGKTISIIGTKDFLSSEVFPTHSFDPNHQQYFPNYALHMIGGGMQTRKMKEWFEYQDYPCPWAWSITTMAAQHLLNEMIEGGPEPYVSSDPIADLYIFDPLGMVLFTSDKISRFFSKTLNMTEWPLQPSYDLFTGRLENMGQFFIYKYPIRHSKEWSLFISTGLHEMAGVSRTLPDGRCFTLSGGAGVESIVDTDRHGRAGRVQTAVWIWSVTGYYDIRNSLLASFTVSGLPQDKLRLNIYPGLLRLGPTQPGLWAGWSWDRFIMGITFRLVPIGAGISGGKSVIQK